MQGALERLGDHDFFVRRWGDAHLPPMLLLHGFPEYGGAWSELAPLLADRFHVIAPDQRGFGQSWAPAAVEDVRMHHLVADMAHLLDANTPAVVMGHEIAHATERHGTEAVTRSQVAGFGVSIATALLGGEETPAYAAALAQGAAALAQLSYGRGAELEADRVGLRIMARAGYDPREAAEFWGRMAALGGGGGIEFLSTHPSNENRINQIQELLPEVMPLYEAALAGGPPQTSPPSSDSKKKVNRDRTWK